MKGAENFFFRRAPCTYNRDMDFILATRWRDQVKLDREAWNYESLKIIKKLFLEWTLGIRNLYTVLTFNLRFKVLSMSFGNSWGNLHPLFFMLDIKNRFTCGEQKHF